MPQLSEQATILDVQSLAVHYGNSGGLFRRGRGSVVRAVHDVSFTLKQGETLALVGESGSGKSTIARALVRAVEPKDGQMLFQSRSGGTIDIAACDARRLRDVRREIRMVFQDPFTSLNPRMTIMEIITEPLRNYGVRGREELRGRAEAMIHSIGLRTSDLSRYPHAFSGGQRQRIGLLRALSLDPQIILADEPTSALDVSVQAQILNLMQRIQNERRISYVFITHDLHVVRHVSDRCAVLYLGQIVESAPTPLIFESPAHPYTRALLAAVPVSHPRLRRKRSLIRSEIPDPANRPGGCAFHPRCPYVQDICRTTPPPLVQITHHQPGLRHTAACHFANELPPLNSEGVAHER